MIGFLGCVYSFRSSGLLRQIARNQAIRPLTRCWFSPIHGPQRQGVAMYLMWTSGSNLSSSADAVWKRGAPSIKEVAAGQARVRFSRQFRIFGDYRRDAEWGENCRLGQHDGESTQHRAGMPKQRAPVSRPIPWRPDLQDPCDSPFGITGTMSCSVDRQSLRCAAGKQAVEEASAATVAAFAYEQGA